MKAQPIRRHNVSNTTSLSNRHRILEVRGADPSMFKYVASNKMKYNTVDIARTAISYFLPVLKGDSPMRRGSATAKIAERQTNIQNKYDLFILLRASSTMLLNSCSCSSLVCFPLLGIVRSRNKTFLLLVVAVKFYCTKPSSRPGRFGPDPPSDPRRKPLRTGAGARDTAGLERHGAPAPSKPRPSRAP